MRNRLLVVLIVSGCLYAFPSLLHAATVIDLDGAGWNFRTTLDATEHPVTVPPLLAGGEGV